MHIMMIRPKWLKPTCFSVFGNQPLILKHTWFQTMVSWASGKGNNDKIIRSFILTYYVKIQFVSLNTIHIRYIHLITRNQICFPWNANVLDMVGSEAFWLLQTPWRWKPKGISVVLCPPNDIPYIDEIVVIVRVFDGGWGWGGVSHEGSLLGTKQIQVIVKETEFAPQFVSHNQQQQSRLCVENTAGPPLIINNRDQSYCGY